MNELIQYLKGYQAWRRGQDERTMSDAGINPVELGQMLDAAIETLEAVASNGPILVQERKIGEFLMTIRELKQECDQLKVEVKALKPYRDNHHDLMRHMVEHDAKVIEKAKARVQETVQITDSADDYNNALHAYISELRQKAQEQ